jgi:hypothetical protein
MEEDQEKYWSSLTPEQQLDAFCCISRRIVDGELTKKGSYRYVLYDVFGWGPESYLPAQVAGYLTIHNAIMSDEDIEDIKVGERMEILEILHNHSIEDAIKLIEQRNKDGQV